MDPKALAKLLVGPAGVGLICSALSGCSPERLSHPHDEPDLVLAPAAPESEVHYPAGKEGEALRRLSQAQAFLRLGQPRAAAKLSAGLAEMDYVAGATRRLRMWALLALERHEELRELLEPSGMKGGEEGFLHAVALLHTGDAEAGARALKTMWWDEVEGPWGLAALRELAALDPELGGPYTEAERHLIAKAVPRASATTKPPSDREAAAALDRLAKRAPQGKRLHTEVRQAIGLRQLRAEEFTLAAETFAEGLAHKPEPGLRRALRLRLGEAYRRGGRYRAAWRQFQSVAESSRDRWAQRAWAVAGQMAIEYRRYDEAKRSFEAALLLNPVGTQRHQALWGLGWVALRTGDYRAARRFFASVVTEAPWAELAPASLYWGGRAAEEMGNLRRAHAELAAVKERFPLTYYAGRARKRLQDVKVTQPAPVPRGRRDPKIAYIQGLLRAEMLLAVAKELPALAERARRLGPQDLAAAERAAFILGKAKLARQFAFWRARRFAQGQAATDILASLFPARYVKLIQREAKQRRLPAELVVALARQESGFDVRAVSKAGALGLLQLMPETATKMLQEERRHHVPSAEEIMSPRTNVRLGSCYLGRMLRAFGGRVAYALAAYNAGPGAVTRWRQRRGFLPEEIFVEEIPYEETRTYVKKTLEWLEIYRFVARKTADPEVASLRP